MEAASSGEIIQTALSVTSRLTTVPANCTSKTKGKSSRQRNAPQGQHYPRIFTQSTWQWIWKCYGIFQQPQPLFQASFKQSVKTFFPSFCNWWAPSMSGVFRSSWQTRLHSALRIPSADLHHWPQLPQGKLRDAVTCPRAPWKAVGNSTSHSDESKGMKLARMRFWLGFWKGLEIFSVQRRVFLRKADDFLLVWSN